MKVKDALLEIGKATVLAASKEKCGLMDDKFFLMTVRRVGNIFEQLNLVLSKFEHLKTLVRVFKNLLKSRL